MGVCYAVQNIQQWMKYQLMPHIFHDIISIYQMLALIHYHLSSF